MKQNVIITVIIVAVVAASSSLHAQMLPSEKQRERKIQTYIEITRARPKDVFAWHDLATLYRKAKRWDDAIKAETKAIEGYPEYAFAYHGRGKAHLGKKNFAAARADFGKAIGLWEERGGLKIFLTIERATKEHVDSYRSRGMAWAEEGKFSQAIADLNTAIKLRKDNARLYYDRASVKEKAGKVKGAVADYKRAGLLYYDRGGQEGSGKVPEDSSPVEGR